MTTRMMVSVTRQDGQRGGNTAATCQMEIDIDDGWDIDTGLLSDRVHQAFAACCRQVDRELATCSDARSGAQNSGGRVANVNHSPMSNGRSSSDPRPATEAQVRAIHAIASKTNMRLASHLDEVYGVSSPQRLTLKQASELIGKLKEQLIR